MSNIVCQVSVLDKPPTWFEVREVSTKMGGDGTVKYINYQAGCYELSVADVYDDHIKTKGILDLEIPLDSGLIAKVDASMP